VEDLVPGAHQRELFLALAQQWAFGNPSYRVFILWNRRSVRTPPRFAHAYSTRHND
jgi:hypothetical protein